MESYGIEHNENGSSDYRCDMSYIHYPSQEEFVTGMAYQGYDWTCPCDTSPLGQTSYPESMVQQNGSTYGPYLNFSTLQRADPIFTPPTHCHPDYTGSVASIGFSRAEHLFTDAPAVPSGINIHHSVNSQTNGQKPKRKRVQTVGQRKAANVRERKRMVHLNEAFDELRKRLPAFNYEKRLSRIETLRLAMTYISFMQGLSEGKDPSEVKLLKYRRSDDSDGSNSDS